MIQSKWMLGPLILQYSETTLISKPGVNAHIKVMRTGPHIALTTSLETPGGHHNTLQTSFSLCLRSFFDPKFSHNALVNPNKNSGIFKDYLQK